MRCYKETFRVTYKPSECEYAEEDIEALKFAWCHDENHVKFFDVDGKLMTIINLDRVVKVEHITD